MVSKPLRLKTPRWTTKRSRMWIGCFVHQTSMRSESLGRHPRTNTEQSQDYRPRASGLLTPLGEFCPARHLPRLLARLRAFLPLKTTGLSRPAERVLPSVTTGPLHSVEGVLPLTIADQAEDLAALALDQSRLPSSLRNTPDETGSTVLHATQPIRHFALLGRHPEPAPKPIA